MTRRWLAGPVGLFLEGESGRRTCLLRPRPGFLDKRTAGPYLGPLAQSRSDPYSRAVRNLSKATQQAHDTWLVLGLRVDSS
jgi:hypothetical protein